MELFSAPKWVRDLGIYAWLLVGVAAALVGIVWLLSLTQTIVMPLITAAVIASVTGPLVVLQQLIQPIAYGAAVRISEDLRSAAGAAAAEDQAS